MEAAHWVSELRPFLSIAQRTPLTNERFNYTPSTYLFCEKNQAFQLEYQKGLVESVKGMVGGEGAIDSATCDAGYSPMLSFQRELLRLLQHCDQIIEDERQITA